MIKRKRFISFMLCLNIGMWAALGVEILTRPHHENVGPFGVRAGETWDGVKTPDRCDPGDKFIKRFDDHYQVFNCAKQNVWSTFIERIELGQPVK